MDGAEITINMRQIVAIKKTVTTTNEVEVEFPIYRAHRLESYDIITRVDSKDREVSIFIYSNGDKFEIEIDRPEWCSSEDHLFGKREYASSEKEFNRALQKAKDFINSIS